MALALIPEGSRLKIGSFRIVLVCILLILMLGFIVGQLLYIQIIHPERLIAAGNDLVLRHYKTQLPRGLITDRNGKILAISVPVKTVDADPKFLHEEGVYADKKAMQRIAEILEIDLNALYKKVEKRNRRFVHLKRYLSVEKAEELKKITKKGLILTDTYCRRYPTGEVNAPLIGILNGDGDGVYGVEQSFNRYLTSTKTVTKAKKDKYNHIVENLGTVEKGTLGGNLILSVDQRLQTVAYQSLLDCVKENDADSGTAVLIDIKTGEILSMVSAPSFDPNDRKHFESQNAKNRTVTDIFEPGSTMKPIVALAALEAGQTSWNEVFDTRPFIVDGKMVRDSHAMESGTLKDIIQYSSNTGMARISMRLGPEKIMDMLERFGFGNKTASGLVGESSGKLNANRRFWAEIDKATLGFGYGVAVTTLQLTSAYATLANGGRRLPVSI
ncbi:MAG: peptidoglycan D,D-transpeptidase FtsI family protein, partial [Succinivibrio sp.]